MKTLNKSAHIGMLSILTSLVLLPGCGKDSNKEKKSDAAAVAETNSEASSFSNIVIASIGDKPFLMQETVDSYIDQLDKAQPGAKMYFIQDANAEKMLIDSIINNKIISEYWIKDEGIFDTPEYQNELKQFVEMCTMQLAQHKFEQSIAKDFEPTEAEALKYYNDNKENLTKQEGGVKAQEVTFSDEKAAIEFLKNAKAPGANFADLAKEAGKEVINLGLITADSMNVDDKIVKRVLKIAKVPAFDIVKVDDTFHVINSTEKIDADYYSFEETQDGIKKMIIQEKLPQIINEKQEELRKKYDIQINEDFFKNKEEASMEKMLASLAEQTGMDINDLKNTINAASDDANDGNDDNINNDNGINETNLPASA